MSREELRSIAYGQQRPITKRTILRRLEQLLQADRIAVLGEGRATRYIWGSTDKSPTEGRSANDDGIARSAAGERL